MTYAAELARHYAAINHRLMTLPRRTTNPVKWSKTCELPTRHPRFADDVERILWIIDHMPAWSLSQRRVLVELTATAFDITPTELLSDSHQEYCARPRHIAMTLAVLYLGHSHTRVARDFNRDMKTVHHAITHSQQAVRQAMARAAKKPAPGP